MNIIEILNNAYKVFKIFLNLLAVFILFVFMVIVLSLPLLMVNSHLIGCIIFIVIFVSQLTIAFWGIVNIFQFANDNYENGVDTRLNLILHAFNEGIDCISINQDSKKFAKKGIVNKIRNLINRWVNLEFINDFSGQPDLYNQAIDKGAKKLRKNRISFWVKNYFLRTRKLDLGTIISTILGAMTVIAWKIFIEK